MIVLTVLKIIGIVLLALLCLLLLLLVVILFSPIRYAAEGEKWEAFAFSVKVRWLFISLLAGKTAEEDKPEVQLRVFGRLLGQKKKKAAPEKEVQKKETPVEEAVLSAAEAAPRKEPLVPPPRAKAEPSQPPRFKEAPPSKAAEAGQVRRIRLADMEEEVPPEETLAAKEDKPPAEEALNAQYFIKMPMAEKKELISLLVGFIKKLLRHVQPKDFFAEGVIGTGDVETTGYVLALCGVLKAGFGNRLQIRGNFTKAMAEGRLSLAGRIRIGTVLAACLWLAVKKPVRKIIKLALKGLGEKRGKSAE